MKKILFLMIGILALGLLFAGCSEEISKITVPDGDSECVNCLSRALPVGATCVDFEGTGLQVGNSVEGAEIVHPLLNISASASSGNLVLIERGYEDDTRNPKAYDATTNSGNDTPNGCLNGNYGMGCINSTPAVDEVISLEFAEGVTVNYFSIIMLDYGDWKHDGLSEKSVTITAYDSAGNELAGKIEKTFDGNDSDYDACHFSGKGKVTHEISTPGIAKVEIQFLDGVDRGVGFDDICFTVEVPVDIKPTSCPNPINVKSKGVLPVAILGTEEFDVNYIDPATVFLEGVAPLRWAWEDVSAPFEPYTGREDCMDCNSDGPDGYTDFTLKFNKQEIIAALGEVEDGDCIVLTLEGELFDGTPIFGEDVVKILKKGKK